MKTKMIIACAVLIALWVGYGLGYQHGKQDAADRFWSQVQLQHGQWVVVSPGMRVVSPTHRVNSLPANMKWSQPQDPSAAPRTGEVSEVEHL